MKRNLYYSILVFALVVVWILVSGLTNLALGAIETGNLGLVFGVALFMGLVVSGVFFVCLRLVRNKFFGATNEVAYRPSQPFKMLAGVLVVLCAGISVAVSYPMAVKKVEVARAEAARKADAAKAQAAREEAERQRLAAMTPEERAAETRSKVDAADAATIAEGEAMLKRRKENMEWAVTAHSGKKAKIPDGGPVKTDEWNAVLKHLGAITRDHSAYQKAQTLLARLDEIDKKSVAAGAAMEEKARVEHRKEFAAKLEQIYIDKRLDTDVTVSGPKNTVLEIKWVLANKVTANDLSRSDVLDTAQKLGFKKVILTDGYDWNWKWDLKPTID